MIEGLIYRYFGVASLNELCRKRLNCAEAAGGMMFPVCPSVCLLPVNVISQERFDVISSHFLKPLWTQQLTH